jgi:hypothetical protein
MERSCLSYRPHVSSPNLFDQLKIKLILGCETSRLPYFLVNQLTDGGEVVTLTRRSTFISVRGRLDPQGHTAAER